ncbi:hypothetical protein BR93DRAFT_970008 [Coniochaeta sp. PMI_546]|nr:hypothetical protein BR93DRAFT_970008 [Coniochaeta sp. PMI_546]
MGLIPSSVAVPDNSPLEVVRFSGSSGIDSKGKGYSKFGTHSDGTVENAPRSEWYHEQEVCRGRLRITNDAEAEFSVSQVSNEEAAIVTDKDHRSLASEQDEALDEGKYTSQVASLRDEDYMHFLDGRRIPLTDFEFFRLHHRSDDDTNEIRASIVDVLQRIREDSACWRRLMRYPQAFRKALVKFKAGTSVMNFSRSSILPKRQVTDNSEETLKATRARVSHKDTKLGTGFRRLIGI